jgi:hypothetical protein
LAGSVLPADFRWDEMIKNGQVKRVASQCGSVDWPVGWLCRSLNMIFFKDVGTGGYDGFTYLNAADQMKWFDGGHGSPLARRNQPYIAKYILAPPDPPAPAMSYDKDKDIKIVGSTDIPWRFRAGSPA